MLEPGYETVGKQPCGIKLEENMLEAIMDRRNIEKALVQVTRNKGSAGVDGMQTDELRDFLKASYQELRHMVVEGMYQPGPVRKVEIPKPQGGSECWEYLQ